MAILVAGLRRFAVILAVLAAVTAGGSLALTALAGWSANRAVSSGFDLVGAFFLIVGFFVGNRGPVRLKGAGAAMLFSERRMRWATPMEREEAISDSAVFVSVGLAMIIIGVAIDSRYRLF
jgi:hypothetical protein